MKKKIIFKEMLNLFRETIKEFPDKRKGDNSIYEIENAALGAFSVFFTQSPSFLAHQRAMEEMRGKSNAQTLFEIEKIPTDNHIRNLLDVVSPKLIFPVFEKILEELRKEGILEGYRGFNGDLLIALDGTRYHKSKKISCESCCRQEHKNKTITYYHSMLTPIIVSPNKDKVIALAPEFIIPQDGNEKQDCENAAAKRWIESKGKKYSEMGVTILGDDLYCHQPICEKLLEKGLNFILNCKAESHKTLYEWIDLLEEGVECHSINVKRWNGRFHEYYNYRYANKVPLKDGEKALQVNWFEVTISKENGEIIYKNSFATNHNITEKNIKDLVMSGRGRWKIENENNNTLKTKGYNLEHNYGHGKKNLSTLFATFIILAFLFHTLLELMDDKYRLIREKLPTRATFFNDIRALTRYICFDSWDHLMDFMMKGLELKLNSG